MDTKRLQKSLESKETPIVVIGLGYVGLPLACLLAEKYRVIGFDIKTDRVAELRDGKDSTREVEEESKLLNPNLKYTADIKEIEGHQAYIVAVPTPVDGFKVPDLRPLLAASRTVGKVMGKDSVVVYESTVYPGVTEGPCAAELEKESGLKANEDFFLGYSPERVNPGDKQHTIEKIVKVVSGSTPPVAAMLESLYSSVISAGVHLAPNIQSAEACKIIENVQRDINIAIVNELAMLFDRLGLDTGDVLAAAGTKWNFLKFQPGLVGGHCIGVDPYYLTHQASGIGFHPEVISAARRVNDSVGSYVAQRTLNLVLETGGGGAGRKVQVGILGVTFKENVPDIRNTKVIGMAEALEKMGAVVHLVDPVADADEIKEEYDRELETFADLPECDALVLAVKHDEFIKDYGLAKLVEKLGKNKLIIDVKGCLPRETAKEMGVTVWRL